jgi:D-glycerate 3-kinase
MQHPVDPPHPLDSEVSQWFVEQAAKAGLGGDSARQLLDPCLQIATRLAHIRREKEPLLLAGVNGAQGSGKSTLCALVASVLKHSFGLRAVHLSIDDFYKTRKDRERLSKEVHPLFMTRGVPGTHDIDLALQVINAMVQAEEVTVPRFDKATDERLPRGEWEIESGPVDIILFEGWCVGAMPQSLSELQIPVNDLEAVEDPSAIWRTRVNQSLHEGDYRTLFDSFEVLLMLRVPSMESVFRWRWQQEEDLRVARGSGPGLMSEKEVLRFLMYYERLTRFMLAEMPGRADMVLDLNEQHQISRLTGLGSPH